MDRQVAQRLEGLSKHEARDDKLAFAISSGRVYGLQQQFYDMRLRKELDRESRNAVGEKLW